MTGRQAAARPPRTAAQLACMRAAGRVVAEIHERTAAAIVPGVTTAALDRIARDVIEQRGARSNFLGYHGFPAVVCASTNHVVIHGIPNERPLDEGDLVSIDCGAIVDGWHADAAYTASVGKAHKDLRRLSETTRRSLWAGIAEMHEGRRLGDVGHAVQTVVEAAGFAVLQDYVGHGIGQALHEKPDVPNEGEPGKGRKIKVGDTFAIEPMVVVGRPSTKVLADGWTVVTRDRSMSAHWEHTVAITSDGPEVLTASDVSPADFGGA